MNTENNKFFTDKVWKRLSSTIERILIGADWRGIRAVFITFLITRIMIFIIVYFSMHQIPQEPDDLLWRYNPQNILLAGLINWDSGWYIPIAQNGYDPQSTAFFPLYPLLIRFVSSITGNFYTSGLLVSNVAFLISLFYLYAFTKEEFDDDTAARAIFYLACAPAAFIFSTVYSEGIFLLFLSACFYYSRNGRWLLAGLFGALCSATRVTGIAAALFILLEALWQIGIRFVPKPWNLKAQIDILHEDLILLPNAWKGILASILSSAGLIAYMVYLNQKFGDPFAFLHAQGNWNRAISWDWFFLLIQDTYNTHKVTGSILAGEISSFSQLMDTFATLIFFPLVILVLLRFRPSLGWFTLISFLLPLTTSTTLSMRRYVLVLIPCYILLALWGKRVWVDRLIIGVSLPLQAFFMLLFSHSYWAG